MPSFEELKFLVQDVDKRVLPSTSGAALAGSESRFEDGEPSQRSQRKADRLHNNMLRFSDAASYQQERQEPRIAVAWQKNTSGVEDGLDIATESGVIEDECGSGEPPIHDEQEGEEGLIEPVPAQAGPAPPPTEPYKDFEAHGATYGKLEPHEILYEYRSSNRAQQIVNNIQHIIDVNVERIEAMVSDLDLNNVKKEVKSIREDLDDMKASQSVLRDEIRDMKAEFGGLMTKLQSNFQTLLTGHLEPYSKLRPDGLVGSEPSGPTAFERASRSLNAAGRGSRSRELHRFSVPSFQISLKKALRPPDVEDEDDDSFDIPFYHDIVRG